MGCCDEEIDCPAAGAFDENVPMKYLLNDFVGTPSTRTRFHSFKFTIGNSNVRFVSFVRNFISSPKFIKS